MSSFKKITIFFLTLFLFLFLFFLYQIKTPVNIEPEEKFLFEVSRGDSFKEIASSLEKEKIISNSLYFNLYGFLSGKAKRLQAGTYELDGSMTIQEIVDKLYRGDVLMEKITVIEGWSINEIKDLLSGNNNFDRGEFNRLINESYDFSFLKDKPDDRNLEGYLFPDTYFLPFLFSEKNLIDAMLLNFDEKLTQEKREEIARQNKSIFDIIIMASLIEKEVRTIEDKKIVSGILWKRESIGMPLQVDATIAYITGKRTTRISIEETRIESPYNTYINRGLPFGPICNPGIESIKAAIYPIETDYFYYLSKPDGETVFSRNLQEHNTAKNKYLRN